MDRTNAIQLIKTLVAKGYDSDTPIQNAQITTMALQISLKGDELDAALNYAGKYGWLNRTQRAGWTSLTHAGETAAKLKRYAR
jgi:hypothetical protein